MKVQIIYLNPEDDFFSTRDMLGWVKAPRTLLVWPDRGRVLTRRLDLVLLKRYASQRQMQIGLLTFDPDVRKDAHDLGIPLFESLEILPEERWQPLQSHLSDLKELGEAIHASRGEWRDRKPISTKALSFFERNRIPFLVLIIFLFVFVIAAFYPTAEIILAPQQMSDQIEMTIPFELDREGISTSGQVLTEKIYFQVSGSETRPTTGRISEPISSAEGWVVFTSHSLQALDIPKGTILRTDKGKAFQTTRDESLPAEIGAQVRVPIEAMDLGSGGNIPEESITRVDGTLGLVVSVNNPQRTSGGEDTLSPSVTQYDLDRLEETLLERLLLEAEEYYRSQIGEDRTFVEESLRVNRILGRFFDHHAGEITDEVMLVFDVEIEGIAIRQEYLWDAVGDDVIHELPDGQALIPGSFLVRKAKLEPANGLSESQLSLLIERGTYAWMDLNDLKQQSLGQSPNDVEEWLDNTLNLARPAIVNLRPEWFPVLPWIRGQIEIYLDWEYPTWGG